MKELLMSKPNGDESNIIRADITVGSYTNEERISGYGYSNVSTIVSGYPNFGQCSNSKITALLSETSLTYLWPTTPMVASNVTITRLDTMYSMSASDVDTTKDLVFIEGSPFFTQQDVDKTIPIEIRFA